MGQTKEGAKKAQETIRKKHGVGPDGKSLFHKKIGSTGGKISSGGPLKGNPTLAKQLGRKGGLGNRRK